MGSARRRLNPYPGPISVRSDPQCSSSMFHHFLKPRPFPSTIVCSLDRATEVCRQSRPGLLVSISDPEERTRSQAELASCRTPICTLDFHDIERPAPGLRAPSSAHITTAIRAVAVMSKRRSLVVHCHAGIARSSAMALLLTFWRLRAAGYDPEDAAHAAFEQILACAPQARPNMLLIALGAQVLDMSDLRFEDRAWRMHRGLHPNE
jgi:predicted protein tyrosine phosphatase